VATVLTDAQLEEYRQLKAESRTKGERALQLTMFALAAFGAIWTLCLSKQSASDHSRYAALVPGLLSAVLMYWVKQLEFSGHRIAKYLRDVLEPIVWGRQPHEGGTTDPPGWESWISTNREKFCPEIKEAQGLSWSRFICLRYMLPDRVHLTFSWVPVVSLSVFYFAPPVSSLKWWEHLGACAVTLVSCWAYVCLARRVGENIRTVTSVESNLQQP